MVSCACRLGPPSSLVPALGAGQPPLAGCVTTYINVPSCLRILNVFLKCAPPGPSTGIMRKFHGRWQIRPHPRDPEHASMSTLDQVGSAAPWRKAGRKFRWPSCIQQVPHWVNGFAFSHSTPPLARSRAPPGLSCRPPQDLALGIYMPPPFDRILKRISCNQVLA